MGPDRNRPEPNLTGSASVYMELFETGLGVYTGPFWNRPGTDPLLDLQNSRSSFGSVPDRFQNGPGVNRKGYPARFSDRNRLEPVPCKHSLGHDLHLK